MFHFIRFTLLLLLCAFVSSPLFERNTRVTHQLWPLLPVQFDEPPPGVLQVEPYFNHIATEDAVDYLHSPLPTYSENVTAHTFDYLHYPLPAVFNHVATGTVIDNLHSPLPTYFTYFNDVATDTVIDYLHSALPTYFDHVTIFTVDYLHYHVPFSFYCSFIMRMIVGFWIFIGCSVYGTVYTPLERRSSRLSKKKTSIVRKETNDKVHVGQVKTSRSDQQPMNENMPYKTPPSPSTPKPISPAPTSPTVAQSVYGTIYTPLGRRSSRLCKTVLSS